MLVKSNFQWLISKEFREKTTIFFLKHIPTDVLKNSYFHCLVLKELRDKYLIKPSKLLGHFRSVLQKYSRFQEMCIFSRKIITLHSFLGKRLCAGTSKSSKIFGLVQVHEDKKGFSSFDATKMFLVSIQLEVGRYISSL